MDNDYTLKTNLYENRSNYLIDSFMLIGYDSKKIIKLITDKNPELPKEGANVKPEESAYSSFDLTKLPKILSEISPNQEKELVPRMFLLKALFPKPLKHYVIKSNIGDLLTPILIEEKMNYSTIVSYYSKEDNIIYYIYAYVFYERVHEKESNYFYSPKIFCFISQYPSFTSFYSIGKNIMMLFRRHQTDIPLEFMIYNIIAFTPSPLGKTFNIIMNSKEQQIGVKALSGYPLIQFNLFGIFYTLSSTTILEIFFFTLLEYKVVFYSENIKLLNLLMYAFSCLCYPCNTSEYYKNIYSLSYEEFLNSESINQNTPCIIGINGSKNDIDRVTQKIGGHFLVEFETKSFKYCSEKNNANAEEADKVRILHSIIRDVVKEKKIINESDFIHNAIKDLFLNLEALSRKVNYTKKNNQIVLIANYFDENNNYQAQNKIIQEYFYHFILRIMKEFYTNSAIHRYGLNKKQEVDKVKTDTSLYYISFPKFDYENEKNTFMTRFRELKIKTFILEDYANPSNVRLSKAVLYELIHKKIIYNKEKVISPNCLESIDIIYSMNDQATNNVEDYDLTVFDKVYRQKYSQYFDKALYAAKKRKFDKTQKKFLFKYSQKTMECDNNMFLLYAYWLNSLNSEQLNELFCNLPSVIQSTIIPVISFTKLSDLFERTFLLQKETSKEGLIISTTIYYFILTRILCEIDINPQLVLANQELFNINAQYNVNKYTTLLLNIYARIIRGKKERNQKNSAEIEAYFTIINSLIYNQLIPDEELLLLINMYDELNQKFLVADDGIKRENVIIRNDMPYELLLANNQAKVKVDYFITQADYLAFDGDIKVSNKKHESPYLSLSIDKKCAHVSNVFSPLKLFNSTKKMLKSFFPQLDKEALDVQLLKEIGINLIFYIRNITTFKFQNDEVIKLILRIIYILSEEYIVEKGNKEIFAQIRSIND